MARLLLNGIALADVDGVLFDKDGTLSHSEPHLISLGQERLQAAATMFRQADEFASNCDNLVDQLQRLYGISDAGVSPAGLLAVASRQHNLIATAAIIARLEPAWPQALRLAQACFQVADQALSDQPIPLLPEADRVLQELRAAGIRCAVISNDSRQGVERFLQVHGLQPLVSAIWSADDAPCKPDPAAVHRLCARMQLDHRRCALIGDADSDLHMAQEAGVALTLGYVAGWRQPPNLTGHEHLIQHWRDLQVECLI
jgi:phosphoglycolate phosphatase